MSEHSRGRIVAISGAALAVAIVATAFALGGSGGSSGSSGSGSGSSGGLAVSSNRSSGGSSGRLGQPAHSSVLGAASAASAAASAPAAEPVPSAAGKFATASGVSNVAENVADGVTATRVVKTGDLGLRVDRGQVQPTMSKLVSLTTSLHGYVSKSSTDSELGSPTGQMTLRIPAAGFDTAVNDAEKLGRVESLTTNATDVTGRYVDLGARLSALRHTRSTYLTILGQARSIGATLSVQQRVDDVQQQIEELQGQLKVLANQSADGTLTVDVSARPAVVTHPARRHHRSGLSAAWHRSVRRFERGSDAIVGALGPLLLVVLILAVLGGIGLLGYRGVRRAQSS